MPKSSDESKIKNHWILKWSQSFERDLLINAGRSRIFSLTEA